MSIDDILNLKFAAEKAISEILETLQKTTGMDIILADLKKYETVGQPPKIVVHLELKL